MKLLLIAASAVFLLTACEGGPFLQRDNQLEIDVACRSIGASLGALAPHRQALSEDVEATIQRVRVESAPLCTGNNPPRTAEVVNQLMLMADDLLTAEMGVK